MRKLFLLLTLALTFIGAQARADGGNQVFYRYGKSVLAKSRGAQVFTDTNGASTVRNDETKGTAIGAGLDLAMFRGMGPGDVLGEISATYSKFSSKVVRQTTSHLLSGTNNSDVVVSALEVVIAPKYRFEGIMDGKVRPWIIPMGLGFLVNSPPSNDTTYLDIGLNVGAGVEYKVLNEISLGADIRHTFAMKDTNLDSSYTAYGLYAGLNF